MKKLLWLDDKRDPFKNDWLIFSPISHPFQTIWVKDYNEFTNWILINGLPDGVCFDNDLGQVKEGKDCAKWIVEYCLDHKIDLPMFNSQSMNMPAKQYIMDLLNNFKKFQNNFLV